MMAWTISYSGHRDTGVQIIYLWIFPKMEIDVAAAHVLPDQSLKLITFHEVSLANGPALCFSNL